MTSRIMGCAAMAWLLALGLWACGAEGGEGGSGSGDHADVRTRPDGGPSEPDTADVAEGLSLECEALVDCIDENPCTSDFCEAGVCVHEPNDRVEPAQILGNCRRERCEGGDLILAVDDGDLPADDGFACTMARCEEGVLLVWTDDGQCDDGERCNGSEVCDLDEGCREGLPVDFDGDGVPDLEDETPPDVDGDGITDCADVETCDGLDNDHNGLVDDDVTDEVLGESCYSGPEGTEGVGACAAGLLACVAGAVSCTQQVLPAPFELCDGLDNDCDGVVPVEEVDAFCRSEVVFGPEDDGPAIMRLEFRTALRAVDVHFNIDTTGSMAGALSTLRSSLQTEIVPGVAAVIPEVGLGVSTFEDYPLFNFGSGTDLPFELWQRVTTDVMRVQEALGAIVLGSGNDIEESGIESLYQLATGAGTRWPRRDSSTSLDPSTRRGFMGEIDPAGDVDYFRIGVPAGTYLAIDVDAAQVGSSLDPAIELLDATGRLIDANDDRDGLDPAMNRMVLGPGPYYLKVRGFGASSTGWYYVQVLASSTALAPRESDCSALEVGFDFFLGTGGAVGLEGYESVTPRPAPEACFADCEAEIGDVRALPWIRSHCFAGGTTTCGDGRLDDLEECDDGNRVSGDGCSGICSLETDGVPPFNPVARFDPGLGHGTRGGAGFRESALPIIVHATDARSHDPADYLAMDAGIEAHGIEDTFSELEKLGARIVGIAARDPARAPVTDLRSPPGMAFRTGANVPTCAFDDSEPRERGVGDACVSGAVCFSSSCIDGVCAPLCAAEECCVGPGGAGRPPPEGAAGQCTLSFEMQGDGSGLTDGIVRGIQALARFATYTVTPVFRDDPANPRDGRCFIQWVEVSEVIQDESCVPQLEFADRDEDGSFESIMNLTPRGRVIYEIVVENRDSQDFDGDLDTSESCGPPGTYVLTMDVMGDDVAVLASVRLFFTIADRE